MYKKYSFICWETILCVLTLLLCSAFSAEHNNISIQYINSPANTIPENSSQGSPLAYIRPTNAESYEITDSHFYIDTYFIENSLQYRLNASSTFSIDYEACQPSFTYTLTIYDNAGFSNIPLTIGDVNESPLIQPQSFNLTENTAVGTNVYQVVATDPDFYTPYNTLTYRIVSGSGSNALTIDKHSGMIRINNKTDLNYEANRDLYLTVAVSDGKFEDVATITIHLININDNAPVVNNQTFSVGKFIPNGTLVSTVIAEDPDGNALMFKLISGNTNDAFAIDPISGKMTVNNASQISDDATNSYFVNVAVSDSGYTKTAQIRIDINTFNYYPVIEEIEDQTGTVKTKREFNLRVEDSNGETLTVYLSSISPSIVPNDSDHLQINGSASPISIIVYEGYQDLTLTICPENTTGSALIRVKVEDSGHQSVINNFIFEVSPNVSPVISPMTAKAFDIDNVVFSTSFTVSDSIGEAVSIVVGSSEHNVVPNTDEHIAIGNNGQTASLTATGASQSFTLNITPVIMGETSIQITATDAGGMQAVETFLLKISSSPEISAIVSQETNEDIQTQAIPFTIRSHEPGPLTLIVLSENTDLIPVDSQHVTLCFNDNCTAGASKTINAAGGIQEAVQLYLLAKDNQNGSVNVSVKATDVNGLTDQTTFAVTIVPQNDAPVFSSVGNAVAYTEGDSAITLVPAPVIVDVDDTQLENAKVVISGNYQSDADFLFFESTERISGVFFPQTATLQLSGMDTLSAYETAFQSITYLNTSDNPSSLNRTFSISVNDGDIDSALIMQSLTLTAINDPPVLSPTTTSITCSENIPIAIAPDLLIIEPDNTQLQNAVVQFVEGYQYTNTEDLLIFSDTANITSLWQASTGTLSLSGTATVAQYQNALKSIQYQNTSDTPKTYTRLIRMVINDGLAQSTPITQTIYVEAVNDHPVVTGGGQTITYIENSAKKPVADDFSITDKDDGNLISATVYIENGLQKGMDILSLGVSGFYTTYYPDSGVLNITGNRPKALYEAALNTVLFHNISENPTSDNRQIAFIVTDGDDASDVMYQTIQVIPVNDPPILVADTLTIGYTENSSLPMADALTISDYDNVNLQMARIRISEGYISTEDQLSFQAIGNINSTWNAQSATLTLTGSDVLSTYRQALNQVTYENLSDNPLLNSRSVCFTINDGLAWSESITRTIQIIPINDVPVVSIDESQTYTENTGAIPIAQSFSMTDVDSITISQLTIQITNHYTSTQDQLAVNFSATIQSSWNAESGTLSLTGERPLSDYIDLVQSLTYENTSDYPRPLERDIRYLAWDSSKDVSDPANQHLIIIPINDPPVLTGDSTSVSITENHTGTVFYHIEASDVDNPLLSSATIVLTGSYYSDEDRLFFEDTLLISSSWNPDTGTLLLNGSASASSYQKAINAIQYENLSDNPQTDIRILNVTISDGALESNMITGTLHVIPVNDRPVLSGAQNYTYIENDQMIFNRTLGIDDPDSLTMTIAIINITENFQADEDSLRLTPVGNITGTYNAEAGSFTLTGPDTIDQFALALSNTIYENSSDNPDTSLRTLSIRIHDGVDESLAITETITIIPINDKPEIHLSQQYISYTENEGSHRLDSMLTLVDPDNTSFTNAVIRFINNTYSAEEDHFPYSLTGNIQVDYHNAEGYISFYGNDTKENYQDVLSKLAYLNSSEDPSDHLRYIEWVVSDGSAESTPVTQTIQIIPINDPPVLTGGGEPLDYQENSDLTIANNINIDDVDNTTISRATIMIADGYVQGEDLLVYPKESGNIIAGEMIPETSVMILTGPDTLNEFEAALRSIQYRNLSDNPQTNDRHITFSVNDGEGTQSSEVVERIIKIVVENDAPHLSVNTGAFINEADSVTITKTHLSATDPDDPDEGLFYTIDRLPFHGVLTIDALPVATGMTLIQGNFDNGQITYQHDGGESIVDSFEFHITDANNAVTEAKTFTITIDPVNDPPTIVSIPDQTATEDIMYTYLVNVSDPDDDNNGNDISFHLYNAPVDMTISEYGLIQWIPREGVLSSGMLTVTVQDGGEDGALEAVQSFSIAVTPVEDPPILSSIDDLLTYGNTQTSPIGFQVFDAEGGPLTLNVFSANLTVAPSDLVLFQDAFSDQINIDLPGETFVDYSLTIMPAYNQYGSVTVTVLATDSTGLTGTTSFVLLVDKVTITVDHGRHGEIIPGHPAKVKKYQFIHFRIQPDIGYKIDNVWIDRQSIGAIPAYTFWNVTEPHTITANFSESSVCTITTLYGNGGSIDPKGVLPMTFGDQPVFQIIPEDGYEIETILVDAIPVGPAEWYRFPPLETVHTIQPLFRYIPKPVATFSYELDADARIPLTVKFQDQSRGNIDQWNWDFGDGFYSTKQNPEHTYMNAGQYNVSLTVFGKGGRSEFINTNIIHVLSPDVDFSATVRTGLAPLSISFINLSLLNDVDQWEWTFGDGQSSSEEQPVHIYTTPGLYTVSLSANIDDNTSFIAKKQYIHVFGRTITGAVTDDDTGLSLSNMRVELWQDDHIFKETLTDEQGNYTFTGLPVADGWMVSVWPDNLEQYQPMYYDSQNNMTAANLLTTRNSDQYDIDFQMIAAPDSGIKGRVHDANFNAVAPHVQVTVYSEKLNMGRSQMTDENGFYTFLGLIASDDYRVSAWSEDCSCDFFYYLEEDKTIGFHLPGRSARTFRTATLVPSVSPITKRIDIIINYGGTISGHVKTDTNEPLKNVWVNAWSDLLELGNGAYTDENGYYQIKCLRAESLSGDLTYRVEVNPSHYPKLIYNQVKQSDLATPVIVDTEGIDFVFSKGLSIKGRVQDENGVALPNIQVRAWSEANAFTAYGQTTTEADGQYTIANLPIHSDYMVAVFPDYYPIYYYPSSRTTENATKLDLSHDHIEGIDFQLQAGAVIRGIVYESDETTPGPMGLIVNIWSESTQTGGEIAIDANGRFEMTGLQSEICDYIISIHHPPYIPAYYGATSGHDWKLSWETTQPICCSPSIERIMILNKGYQLQGKIIHNNKAISDALIQVWSPGSGIWLETTSFKGYDTHNFELKGLANGTYELHISAEGYSDKTIKNIGIHEDINDLVIQLEQPEYVISGTVYGLETGKKAQINAWAQSIQSGHMARITGDGNPNHYTITNLTPANDYRVEFWSLDYPYQVYPNGKQFTDAEFVIVDGIETGIDFSINTTETGNLSGTITPWPGIKSGDVVFIDAVSQRSGSAKNARLVFQSSEAMTYQLEGLAFANDYVVSAWSNVAPMMYYRQTFLSNEAEKITVTQTPVVDVNFFLSDGLSISGILYDSDLQPIAGALVSATSQALNMYQSSLSNTDGRYEIKGLLPSDDYTVSTKVNDLPTVYYQSKDKSVFNPRFTIPVNLSSVNVEQIDFHIPEGSSICGFVQDMNGYAIQFAWISVQSDITGAKNDTFSDIHGNYCVKGLPLSVDYQITITPPAPYVETIRSMIPTGTSELKCIVDSGYEMTGSIKTQDGDVLSMVDISIWSSSNDYHNWTLSNSNGQFFFQGIPQSQDLYLTAQPTEDQKVATFIDGPFSIYANSQRHIILSSALEIKGQITAAASGKMITDALITAYASSIHFDEQTRSILNGYFTFSHLPEANDYELTISHPEYATVSIPFVKAQDHLVIALESGGSITGHVQDESGMSMSDIRIDIHSDDRHFMSSVRTDKNGDFIVTGLPKSGHTFTLSAYHHDPGYAPVSKSGQASGSHVSLLMLKDDSAIIQGTIMDSLLTPPPSDIQIMVRLFDSDANYIQKVLADESGYFSFKGLDADISYKIKCSVSEGALIDPIQWIGSQGEGTVEYEAAAEYQSGQTFDIKLLGEW
jgi:PKD repeat protein